MQSIEVKRNCDGDFPEWKPDVWTGWVEFETPDICKGCDFVMQCTARLSADILWMDWMKVTPEEEEIMARMQKAVMLNAFWEMSDEEVWEQALETQRQITSISE